VTTAAFVFTDNDRDSAPDVLRIAPRTGQSDGPKLVSEQLSLFTSDSSETRWALNAYREAVWSYAAISQIATDLAFLPTLVRRGPREEDKEVDAGLLIDLLEAPNPVMAMSEIIELMAIYTMAGGRSYNWLSLEDGTPRLTRPPEAIWPLPPHLVEVKTRPPASVTGYTYRDEIAGGNISDLSVKDVIPIRLPDPLKPMIGGLSPLIPAKLSIFQELNAGKWNSKFFKNGATPGVIVQDENPVSAEEQERFMQRVRKHWIGSDNAFQFLYLAGFKGKVDAFKADHKEMGFIELVKQVRKDQLAAIGTPPAMAGEFENLNLAQVEMQERTYWTKTLVPLSRRIEQAINRFLVPRIQPGVFWRFDLSGVKVLQEDLNRKAERERILVGTGLRTPNEIREEEGLPTYPEGERFYMDSTLQPVKSDEELEAARKALEASLTPGAGAADSPASAPGKGEGKDGNEDAPARALGELVTRVSDEAREVRRAAAWRGFNSLLMAAERDLERVWSSVLDGIGRHVVRRVRETAPSLEAVGRRARADTTPLLIQLPGSPSDYLPAADDLIAEVTEEHGAVYRRILARFGEAAVDEITEALVFDAGTPGVLVLVERDEARVGEEVRRILDDLHDTLEGGINAGESIGDLTNRIKDKVGQVRAERIARTEALAAANSGTTEGYRQTGVQKHEWLTSRDGQVRESHADLDEEQQNIGDKFTNGVEFPGDPMGPPGETVNCRCTVLPVVDSTP